MTDTQAQKEPQQPIQIAGANVINAYLAPDKLLTVMEEILTKYAGKVWTVVFHESMEPNAKGKQLFSAFYYTSRTLAINVGHTFDNMNTRVGKNDCIMLGHAFVWFNFLISLHHEIKHSINFDKDGIKIYDLPEEEQMDACLAAQEWGTKRVHELAKTVDIEPPPVAEWGYLSDNLDEFYKTMMEFSELESPEPFSVNQMKMWRKGFVIIDDAQEVSTLRKYCELQLQDDDPAWEVALIHKVVSTEPELKEQGPEGPSGSPEGNTFTLAEEEIEPPPPDMGEGFEEAVYTEGSEAEILPTTSIQAAAAKSINPAAASGSLADPDLLDKPIVGTSVTTAPDEIVAPGLPVHTLTMSDIEHCVYLVNKRLASHIFFKCQFSVGYYINPFGVMDWIPIQDIPNADKLFVTMDCLDDAGKLQYDVPIWTDDPRLPNKPIGHIRGRVFMEGKMSGERKLPGYCVHLNVQGAKHRRTLLPQNPEKMGKGVLTTWAQKAQGGHFIILVYKDLSEAEKAADVSGIQIKMEAAPGQGLEYVAFPFVKDKRRVITG